MNMEKVKGLKIGSYTENEFNQVLKSFEKKTSISNDDINQLYDFYRFVSNMLTFNTLEKLHGLVIKYLNMASELESIWKLYSMELVYFYFMDSPSGVMKYSNRLLKMNLNSSFKASAYCYILMILLKSNMFVEANPYIEEVDIFINNAKLQDIKKFHLWINELDIYATSKQANKYMVVLEKLDDCIRTLYNTKYYDVCNLFYRIHKIYGSIKLESFFPLDKEELYKEFELCLSDLRRFKQISENYALLFIPMFSYFKDFYNTTTYVKQVHSLLSYKMNIHERVRIYEYLVCDLKCKSEKYEYIYKEYIESLSDYYHVITNNKVNEVRTELINYSLEKKLDVISAKYHYDTLTGCYNRVFLSEIEEKILEAGDMVIYLDLNDFKKINDTFGHDAGDKQLKKFAEILMSHFVHDIVFRLGGDEFVVLTRGVPEEVLRKLDDARMEYLTTFNLMKNRYGFSAGVLVPHHMALHEAIKEADKYMYECKKTGLPVVIKEK